MKEFEKELTKETIKQFELLFSNSSFWLDDYPNNYKEMKKFIKEITLNTIEKIQCHCLRQYDEFKKEIKS